MRNKYIKHISFVFFTVYLLASLFVVSSCSKKSNNNIIKENEKNSFVDMQQEETSDKEIKEISAGFYLYDQQNNPIYKEQQINITEDMEFNLECVNTCNAELNYTIMILINNHYQKARYSSDVSGEMQDGKSKLGAGDTEKINVKFESDITKKKKNDIRIVMIYYMNSVPEDDLDLILVGEVTEKHTLLLDDFIDGKIKDNEIAKYDSYSVNKEGMENGIWITNQKPDQIPPFDFRLNCANFVYLNTIGNTNDYYGVLFIDGTPQLVQNDRVFHWKQKKTKLSTIKIKSNFEQGSKIFVYMYEKDSIPEDTYMTTLYYCE